MLLALKIENLAVIQAAEVTFRSGLTVLTGETGAGKSILVDALGLLLGGRADPDAVRAGAGEASVEAIFGKTDVLAARLSEHGLADLGDEVCVRRVIGRGGRGKAYVNGSLVTVGVLARVLRGVVDVAGQHEHISLFDPAQHRALLDRFGQLQPSLQRHAEAFQVLQGVMEQIASLGGDERQVRERMDFLRYQLNELEGVRPEAGEDVRLEEERRRLLGAEKLRRAAALAEELLSSADGAAVKLLGRAVAALAEASRVDGALSAVAVAAQAAQGELEEASRDLARYLERLSVDPGRLLEVDERLDVLRRLCRKHHTDVAGLMERGRQLSEELGTLERRTDRLGQLELERAAAEAAARATAQALTRERQEAARRLGAAVRDSLAALAMPRAAFEVALAPAALRADGADDVQLLFSANPGEPVRPLEKVASGGEASRLLLALKRALTTSDPCATYVLDEADAGVSGATAEVVGRMIKEVSAHRQVLCITHLPQVAAYADAHLRVEKHQHRGRTVSRVQALDAPEQREGELARMLSGVEVTQEARGAAHALIRAAGRAVPRQVKSSFRTRRSA
jgi:DNA repair protein RecN (Recombination protein N)